MPSEIKQKLWNGRKIKEELFFNKNEGAFKNLSAAETFLTSQGYTYGSSSKDRSSGGNLPIAIIRGPYILPQKWYNLTKSDKLILDGVMISSDLREGEVKVILFEDKKVL